MTETEKVLLAWSSGKESTMALYELQKTNGCDISALLTTVTEGYDRISMHGVQSILLKGQGESLGLPFEKVYITKMASSEEYDAKMRAKLTHNKSRGVQSVAFRDVFLEDVRKYREKNLAKIGMRAIFPLWKRDTIELARTFVDLGFKSVITCVDSTVLDRRFVGRDFNEQFLRDLPPNVDPCGENGEFHSFVYDGPIFGRKISHRKGEIILRDNRFYYCDLIPT